MIVQSTLLMNHLPARKENAFKQKDGDKLREGIDDTKEFKDRIAVLTIAYHNLAVEQEFMHMVSPLELSIVFDFSVHLVPRGCL